jgi:hypothetical protein
MAVVPRFTPAMIITHQQNDIWQLNRKCFERKNHNQAE